MVLTFILFYFWIGLLMAIRFWNDNYTFPDKVKITVGLMVWWPNVIMRAIKEIDEKVDRLSSPSETVSYSASYSPSQEIESSETVSYSVSHSPSQEIE